MSEYDNNFNANRQTNLEALMLYRDKLTSLVKAEEIQPGGNVLKDSLYEQLKNVLNALSNLSHPNNREIIFKTLDDHKTTICLALSDYIKELRHAAEIAIGKLGDRALTYPELQKKTNLIERAQRFMQCEPD